MNKHEPNNIVFATDNSYGIQLLVSAASLVSTANTDTTYQVTVLVPNDFNEEIVHSLNAILTGGNMPPANIIRMGDAYKAAAIHINHTSLPTYYRLAIPHLLACNVCLYLDCDTIVCDDLSDLFRLDMSDFLIAGVKAAGYYWPPERLEAQADKLMIPSFDSYVNAGVLVMNVAMMREQGLEEKFDSLLSCNFSSQDQDIINSACYGRIRILPPIFNSMTKYSNQDSSSYDDSDNGPCLRACYTRDEWAEACSKPVIIHYADKIKPWDSMSCVRSFDWLNVALSIQELIPGDQNLLKRIAAKDCEARLASTEKIKKLSSENRLLKAERKSLQELHSWAKDYLTARLDVTIVSNEDAVSNLKIEHISDDWAHVDMPPWLQEGSCGYRIESTAGFLDLHFRCHCDGTFKIRLMARDVRDSDGKRVPRWVSYRLFLVNGKSLLSDDTPAWHDDAIEYVSSVSDGDEIALYVEWAVKSFDNEYHEAEHMLDRAQSDLKATVSSRSYRLGHALLSPFRIAKNCYKRLES